MGWVQAAAKKDRSSGSKCELHADAEMCVLRLSITLTFTAFDIRWEPAYEFKLMPVALEPIDVLAAKVEDLELEVETLKNQASEEMSGALFARAKPTRIVDGFEVEWTIAESANSKRVSWVAPGDRILIPEKGVYMISLELTGECAHHDEYPVVSILDNWAKVLGDMRCNHSEKTFVTHHLVASAYLKEEKYIEIEVSSDFEFDSDKSSLFIHLVR